MDHRQREALARMEARQDEILRRLDRAEEEDRERDRQIVSSQLEAGELRGVRRLLIGTVVLIAPILAAGLLNAVEMANTLEHVERTVRSRDDVSEELAELKRRVDLWEARHPTEAQREPLPWLTLPDREDEDE